MERRTYAVVDLEKIEQNIRELKRCAGTDVLAVVKADAYGHGMKKVVDAAKRQGVKYFAVATPDEALEFRSHDADPSDEILILSPVENPVVPRLVAKNVSLCVFLPEHVKAAAAAARESGEKARLHIKLDTGMGRVGLRSDEELHVLLDAVKAEIDVLEVKGLFTHFAAADEENKTYTRRQLRKYEHYREIIQSEGFNPLCHASNSAATIEVSDAHFDLCRMGISMYGYMPSDEVNKDLIHLEPALSLYSYVSYVKTIEKGESVSYGRTYTAPRTIKVATVPIGYADGYPRALSNKGFCIIGGKKAPIIGRVCMDQIMLDVTNIPVAMGDTVVLMGKDGNISVSADDIAALADTISYEILCGISARVPRKYRHG